MANLPFYALVNDAVDFLPDLLAAAFLEALVLGKRLWQCIGRNGWQSTGLLKIMGAFFLLHSHET